ncbi:PREDICTED: lysosomal Pro-X carboxypeptidase [Crocodylus porosus]|uniref:lysosomal Pro-X carboxypeptidase n=1 Tax=Crocodylus porosus TaxID=8502 RepID=UPI000938B2A7|nr:PREDICTED: lysosomal Pro-X carboxypeptidase [Crocodylus porosus]
MRLPVGVGGLPLVLLFLGLLSPGRARRPPAAPRLAVSYRTCHLPQQVDHFGFLENRTFQQRYLIADQYWKKDGGSILFYTGNEGDITWFCNNTGFMWEVAEELNAMLVFAEHRYYGESLPFGNKSFSDSKHLNYLTSEQALADFAILIQHIRKTIPGAQNTPVIAIGGSYGGMLAAWLRMKYPHVVDGALAASAPIWQFEDLVPCGVFSRIVTNDFKKSGKGCSESIRNSWEAIKRISSTGNQLPMPPQHLCSSKNCISQAVCTVTLWVISHHLVACKFLKDPSLSDKLLLQNIFQAINIYYNYSGVASCLNISHTATKNLGEAGWYYQVCTEMVMPMCTDGVNDMFEPEKWDFQAFSEECFKLWGVRPRPSWILSVYGGKNISSHSNIIFSNGGLDPWSGGGVTQNITNSLVAIVIPEGAHHLDLRSSNPCDPESVRQARALEVHYMKQWIGKARQRH